MKSVKTRIKQAKILGSFSKGTPESVQVSFSRSASDNCDDSCRMKYSPPDENGDMEEGPCYAIGLEVRYTTLSRKLERHQAAPPQNICKLAAFELSQFEPGSVDWFRNSVSGSLPQPAVVRDNREFKVAFHDMIAEAKRATGDPGRIHIPVESYDKYRFYQPLVADLGVVVRESLQGTWKRRIKTLGHAASVVVGEGIPVADREAECQRIADLVRSWDKSVVICPAVIRNSKCGKCRACAVKVDLVIYPLHK